MRFTTSFFRLGVIIAALPNTISNGQTVDATPVMADLNHIVNQVNANAADVTLVAYLASANSFTQAQSGVAATVASNFPIASQIQNSALITLTSTLGTNTITARCAAIAIGSLVNGQVFTFVPSQTNTGPVTLNPDGVGATSIFLGGTNVMSGHLVKDVPLAVRYQSPRFHAIESLAMANQAQMEAAASLVNAVAPGTQHLHPGSAKAFCVATAGGTIDASYNMTSVTDVSAGVITFVIATDFSSTAYAAFIQGRKDPSGGTPTDSAFTNVRTTGLAAGSVTGSFQQISNSAAVDPDEWYFVGFGDQ